MSKELVISAGSHERRVAIMEEGQLVEIYIEREKEFALVGSIYKGKVTRVLPGMQSAFVEIGLDGDAFLYVSDVFENLEDYDHGHAHDAPAAARQAHAPAATIELLPGETLHAANVNLDEIPLAPHELEHLQDIAPLSPLRGGEEHGSSEEISGTAHHREEHHGEEGQEHDPDAQPSSLGELPGELHADTHGDPADERQPESNASAPQNFSPHYNPTQSYGARGASDRGGRGNDRGGRPGNGGQDRGGDRGGDRGRGRWGRRGGRRRGGSDRPGNGGDRGPQGNGPRNAPPQNAGPGRNLPPSKYASPQGESRGPEPGNFEPRDNRGARDNRGDRGDRDRGGYRSGPSRTFEPRPAGEPRRESTRHSSPSAPVDPAEEPIVLPGESLAKYRGKPAASAPPPVEHIAHDQEPEIEDLLPNRAMNAAPSVLPVAPPTATPGSQGPVGGPRRFSGGLPRWLLAEEGVSDSTPASDESGREETGDAFAEAQSDERAQEITPLVLPESHESSETAVRADVDLDDDQVASLSSELVEAKHEETQEHAKADAILGGAEFDEEEDDEEDISEPEEQEEEDEEEEELQVAPEAVQTTTASERAEAEAEAAHEEAHADAQEAHAEAEETAAFQSASETVESTDSSDITVTEVASYVEEESILLPGETRSPRAPGAPREDFPRESARVGGGNPRSRFQRPFRSGGRDRGPRRDGGRDGGRDRGGFRPEHRSGGGENRSTDSRGSSRPPETRSFENRGSGEGRPRFDRGRSGGGRFERRPGGGGHRSHSGPSRRPQLISEMLKAGQDVVVQIAKEPLGKKGARITSHVALPGRFLVYMPTIDHIGVSRKIESAENRSRLRRLVGEARGSYPGGFIVRTAAGGATDEEIRTDIDFLGKTWNEIKQKSEERKAPALLHRDLNLVERILRDYVSDDFTAIWIDNEEEYGKVVEFVSRFQPKLVTRVKLYSKETPIFEEFGIQHELDKALRAKVWLKSGGYIVINHTEALVAIDVNTGKFVGKGSIRLEDTIVKTNLEAVKEIVRQIRLRDLGGIIVVDFIDMEERRNREKVLSALQQALEEDKAPSKALSFNEFGLVCITRKRTKQALERVLCQPCPYCTGSGMVKSIPTLCYEISAEARKMAAVDRESPNLTLRVNPEIAKALKTRESMLMDELEQTSHKHVIIQSDATLHWEQYDIY
jgi:Rne/Rng family ribonuclease